MVKKNNSFTIALSIVLTLFLILFIYPPLPTPLEEFRFLPIEEKVVQLCDYDFKRFDENANCVIYLKNGEAEYFPAFLWEKWYKGTVYLDGRYSYDMNIARCNFLNQCIILWDDWEYYWV